MEEVYKCDFCSRIDKDPEKMAQHEEICSHNPELETCGSCSHFHCAINEEYDFCHCKIDVKDWFDIWDNNKSCEKWEEGE